MPWSDPTCISTSTTPEPGYLHAPGAPYPYPAHAQPGIFKTWILLINFFKKNIQLLHKMFWACLGHTHSQNLYLLRYLNLSGNCC